ncbi:MAG: toxin [Leptospirales bacterium]
MKKINWDKDKNQELQIERGISFEVVTHYLELGKIVDIMEHPNKSKYPHQKIFLLNINKYIYMVPFVENDHEIFLKTIIPSRKATRDYLKEEDYGSET